MIQGFNIILICYFINIVLINTFLYYLFSKVRNLDSKFLNLQTISESIKKHDNNNYKNVEILLKNILDNLEVRFDKLEFRVNKIETRLSNLENRFNQIETRFNNLENKSKKDIYKVVKKIKKIKKIK